MTPWLPLNSDKKYKASKPDHSEQFAWACWGISLGFAISQLLIKAIGL
jgi:hypothetical protein